MSRDNTHIQIKQATDIVQLIGEHIRIIPSGKEFKALCPFHDDKNPSMHIVPHKQFYKCFSCGASGDAYTFVMEFHKMTFPEAMEFLAKRAGITIEKNTRQQAQDSNEPTQRQRILKANQFAMAYFEHLFNKDASGEEARGYVARRGISAEMIEAFKIGYAPDGWDGLATQIRKRKHNVGDFKQAGLVAERKNSDGEYDKLRHRLIFPILDNMGQPIAFGGRKLREEDEPKYLNSPETPLFNKSATLFGMHLAQRPIINSRTAIIVEGYTDVIAAHQAGADNVVATLGTALTNDHARILRRYADRVILVFDADEAGQRAADRGIQVFFKESIDIDIAILPDGLDPADLLAKDDGMVLWQNAMNEAMDAISFQFDRVRGEFDKTSSLSGKQRIIEDYIRQLVQMGLNETDLARKGLIRSKLGQILKLDQQTIDQLIQKFSGPTSVYLPPVEEEHIEIDVPEMNMPSRANAHIRASRMLMGCLLNQADLFNQTMPDGRPLCESIAADDFKDRHLSQLFTLVSEYLYDVDTDEIETLELREVIENESLLRLALNLKYEADQLIEQTGSDYMHQLLAAAHAMSDERAEREYAEQKMHLQMNDNRTDEHDAQMQRLQLAVAHARAHPSARRTPHTRR